MNIPNVPNDRKVVDDNGSITDVWAAFFSSLVDELNGNLSDEGFVLPQQNSINIGLLSNSINKSRILWNSDTEKAMVNNDGTFKEILTV